MKWLAGVFGVVLPVCAQFKVDEAFKEVVYTNAVGETFAYRLWAPQFPEAGRKYPLILFLHGSGECGTDNRRQLGVGLPRLLASLQLRSEPVMVLAPQCQNGNGWVRRPAMGPDYAASREPTPALEVALELCRHLVAERQADPQRLYITGLSLGGFGTWDAIQREPELFAAAIPICGGGDLRRVQAIKRFPLWVVHGAKDQIVPVDCSRRLVELLRQCGNRKLRYTEIEGAGHNVWDQTYASQEVLEWLFRQTRAPRPWWRFWE